MLLNEISTANISFYNNYIVVSRESLVAGSVGITRADVMRENRRTCYNGFMSPSTKRRVRTILTTWLTAFDKYNNEYLEGSNVSKRRLTFATLTLSGKQQHDDNWIKRNMLNRMLLALQKKHNVKYYFWRAEKQKNGNIHFHIVVDSYIRNTDLQSEWNSIQADNGYLNEFFAKFKRYNAPSTDIRAISDTVNGINYVMKYISKNPDELEDEKMKVSGRIWGCSKELKELKPYFDLESQDLGNALAKAVKNKDIVLFDSDYFQVYRCDTERFLKKYLPDIYRDYMMYYVNVYAQLYNVHKDSISFIQERKSRIETLKKQPKTGQLAFSFADNIEPNKSNHWD